jgi:basic membrane lipoprotein Med (substrate-binding protein (PBP1-ABC) superfamily)
MFARRFSTVFHMVLWTAVVGCGRGSDQAKQADSTATTTSSVFRVALLTPGPITDQSWNTGAYNGLKAIQDSLGAQVSHIQTKTPAEFEENFRQYGAQGYQLVFGHGFEFQDAALRVAPEYPKTVYVTTSGNSTAANVAGMTFAFEEASYLAGMVAGAMTKTNTIGVIGGTELPPVRASFEAFAAGATAANPRVKVITSYVGGWDDVSAGKEQALAQIGRGADVLFQNADAAGLGVFQAAKERGGVWVVGSNSDQNGVAPDVTLGSVVIDLPRAFLLVAREVKAGTFRPRVVSFGMADKVVRLVMNPALAKRVPAATRAAVDSVGKLIAAGTFRPPGVWDPTRDSTLADSARRDSVRRDSARLQAAERAAAKRAAGKRAGKRGAR